MSIDFLIVGAGIGGAVLANLLARAGKRVLILEREATPPQIVRPEVLWPASVQFLDTLLPRDVLHETALMPLQGLQINHRQSSLVHLTQESFATAGVQPWSSHGFKTRALLLAEARCDIERGVEVVGLLKEAGRVVGARVRPTGGGAEREIQARWTVGDDGGRSIVRQECGIDMPTRMLPLDPLLFAFDWPAFLEPGTAQLWINPHRARSGIYILGVVPRPGGSGAGLIIARPGLFDDPDALQRALNEFLNTDPRLTELVGSRQFPGELLHVRLLWGHAVRYGTDGAVLMGDAAHVVTPAGGQGANMAIADARVLADVGVAGESQLIRFYEARRRAANERSIGISRTATRVLSLPDFALAPLLPTAIRILKCFPQTAARGLRAISTAFLETPAR